MKIVYLVYEDKNEDPLSVCLSQKAVVRVMNREWEARPDAKIWWDEVEAEE